MKKIILKSITGLGLLAITVVTFTNNLNKSEKSNFTIENIAVLVQANAEVTEYKCFGSSGDCVTVYDENEVIIATVKGKRTNV